MNTANASAAHGDRQRAITAHASHRDPVVQTLWNCVWSRPPKHIHDVAQRPLLVCGRLSEERCVSQETCETCIHWSRQ
jgi:hypothetical protein